MRFGDTFDLGTEDALRFSESLATYQPSMYMLGPYYDLTCVLDNILPPLPSSETPASAYFDKEAFEACVYEILDTFVNIEDALREVLRHLKKLDVIIVEEIENAGHDAQIVGVLEEQRVACREYTNHVKGITDERFQRMYEAMRDFRSEMDRLGTNLV